MASIHKTASGSYAVHYRDQTGRQAKETFARPEDAKARKAALDLDPPSQHRGPSVVDPSVLWEAYSSTWVSQIEVEESTRESYRWGLSHLTALDELKVRQIRRADIKALVVTLKARKPKPLSRRSIRMVLGTLHTCLEEALEDGIIRTNPAARLKRLLKGLLTKTAVVQQPLALTFEQRELFEAQATERFRLLFYLLFRTGLRIGEALALQWGDLEFAGRKLHVRRQVSRGAVKAPKTRTTRVLEMSSMLRAALQDQDTVAAGYWYQLDRPRPEWVFCQDDGVTLWDKDLVYKAWQRTLKRAGLPHFPLHSTRHTFATLAILRGASLRWVQQALGHTTIAMTMRYASWLPVEQPGIMDALDRAVDSRAIVTETVTSTATNRR
jgi:integrase